MSEALIMYEPTVSVIYEGKNARKYKFFRWKQGRGCWRSRAFFFGPEANPFASRENVMLSHARLTTTEVPLCEALTPPHLLRWHCSLTSSWSWAIMQLPGVNEGKKNTVAEKDLCSENLSYILFFPLCRLQTNKNFHLFHRWTFCNDFSIQISIYFHIYAIYDFTYTPVVIFLSFVTLVFFSSSPNPFYFIFPSWLFASSVAFCCSEFLWSASWHVSHRALQRLTSRGHQ